jgi:hypothetical protein
MLKQLIKPTQTSEELEFSCRPWGGNRYPDPKDEKTLFYFLNYPKFVY